MTETKTFFEHQRLARRNTRTMVLLFTLAVIAVVVSVDLVLAVLYVGGYRELYADSGVRASWAQLLRQVPASLYVWGAVLTAATIFAVSLFNVSKLASGGVAVAQMVGARAVEHGTRDPLERRLVNVVEEMAIASGVRMPAIYVMDGEPGINAFAAGWDISGTVVAVTRGTLEALTRDELQGVIGHEFSHILNGDMRLNIRMIGVLAGIVFIGAIGDFLMRARGERDKGMYIFLAGLALFVIGYVGLFFARLIKAAVSREREFLADASSVQFTRNPDGIAGALDQIRASSAGALIQNRRAEDMSHMFFGQGIKVHLSGLFDTHPPLEERIRRVRPGFQAVGYRKARPPVIADAAPAGGAAGEAFGSAAIGLAAGAEQQGRRTADVSSGWRRSAGESAKLVGTMDAGKVDYAARLLASLPAPLRESLREPEGAAAALVALLLAPVDNVMQQQLLGLRTGGQAALGERARAAAAHTRRLGPAFHLSVIDLALPAIKGAPEAAKKALVVALETVIHADRRVSLHEFVVLTMVQEQLARTAKPAAAGSRKLAELQAEAGIVLALIAHAGTRRDVTGARQEELQAALRAGAKEMGLAEPAPVHGLSLDAARAALEALKGLAPLQKALLIRGLFAAASADGTIRVAEAELLRLVGAVLDCPLPPLLEEIDPATLAA